MAIRIGIMGYGNLGRGVECALRHTDDLRLAAIFTRRDPKKLSTLTEGVPVLPAEQAVLHKEEIDIMILCGGSAKDLPVQTPLYSAHFHVVDSFDTHANINRHFAAIDPIAREAGKLCVISAGWDPGLFSVARLMGGSILPSGADYTFWGKGVSQGHSDAIRQVTGVADAKQYTIPVEQSLEAVRAGGNPALTTRQKHLRVCYVVAQEGADLSAVEREIVEMPNYFADYDTTVHFVTAKELAEEHAGMPHGGTVFRTGSTGFEGEHKAVMEYRLQLDSNPEFTSSVLVAYARAAFKLAGQGLTGCITPFDVPPAALSPLTADRLRATLL